MLKLLTLGGLAALASPGLARPTATNHPGAGAGVDEQRHRRGVGFCFWGCDRGSYRNWWDTVRRHCTCDNNWGSSCCDTYTGPCYANNPELCAQDKLSEKTFPVSDILGQDGVYNGPLTLGTAADNLPPNMQGMFWLQDQAASSSIVSFGRSRDGDGLSVWNANSHRQISIRVGGDKVWSGASNGSTWELVEGIDLVYHFEGTPTANPTHFNIIPEAMNFGFELSGALAEWALSFQMDLIAADDARRKYPATATRPAAVQWARNSSFAGVDAASKYYEIAQIIDGAGRPTAALDAWVAYNSGGEEWQDGTIYYRSA